MEKKKLKEIEESTFENDDSPEVPPSDIVAYNELRSCADLHRMYVNKTLEIQPEFQREIVWKATDQTRFIDSLIKQLPIPSMCFSLDYKTQKWQVIDGLQRMATIIKFLSGETWTLSKLEDISPEIAGQSVAKLRDERSELHSYYTRVENLTLPITVLRCDLSKTSHTNYLFTIFHRLNTGGMQLNNQEIRNCIFSGSFNDLLKELNRNSEWMKINRMKKDVSYRFRKIELILRFFAFYDSYSQYNGKLSKYLNDYMGKKRNADKRFLQEKRELFTQTVDIVYRKVFGGTVPPSVSVTVLESLLFGVSSNLNYLDKLSPTQVSALFNKMLKHEEFSEQKLSEGLSQKDRVLGRLNATKRIFAGK